MLTHGSLSSLRAGCALGGFVTAVLSIVSTSVGEVVVPPGGWALRPGCTEECEPLHVLGEVVETQGSVIASPVESSYSVHHRVGAVIPEFDPQAITCFFIHNPALPGAPDDIVKFDDVVEPIRTDLLGTVPMVTESDTAQPSGRRLLIISTKSPEGTDLFPAGISQGGVPLTDACFSIGLPPDGDPLTWAGSDIVVVAAIEFLINNVVVAGPFDAISFFINPWNGVVEITLPNGAGNGYNGVRLSLLTEKSLVVANDGCRSAILVSDGDTAFSTIGATTDGPAEAAECLFFSYSDIGSDIWYRYKATCTGDLTVDLCDSDYDSKVAVYDGVQHCPDAPPLDCNDDSCGIFSFATAPVVFDQFYTIRIGGYLGVQGTGTMRLSCNITPPPSGACCDDGDCLGTKSEVDCQNQNGTWFPDASCPSFSCPVTPPPNDACTDCIRVETGEAYQGRTTAATGTDISSCPLDGMSDSLDVWHCWTADCTGQVSITTCGSSFDTTLAVFDSCEGEELECDDDGCPTQPTGRSKVTLNVTEGVTYFIRVAGYNNTTGNYLLTVDPCKNACCTCIVSGCCGLATPAECETVGGTLLGPGSVCRGDLDNNGIDDACEPCPVTSIAGTAPESGTVDARQPNARNALLPRQGIGSSGESGAGRESIVIVLNPRLPDAEGCFDVCETKVDPILGANTVSAVTYHGAGVYELVLDHAITAGGVTTIEFLGDGSFVEYIAHPGNVDGGELIDGADVEEHVNCCLGVSELCVPMWGIYSCDTDRSLLVTPADTLGVVDLMNGTQVWDAWLEAPLAPLPTRGTTCPTP